jgi:uncharacterized protein (DUF1330 family)
MNANYKIVLAVVAGAALGAAAVQGLHAQAKPKAYIVSETEVLDAAALATYSPLAVAATQAAGAIRLAPAGGKIVALVGDAPKRITITQWESVEKAQAYRSSEAYNKLAPQRDKAIKRIRTYIVEGAAN